MGIITSTRITFPGGAESGVSEILLCKSFPALPNQVLVVTKESPFHPLDHYWPDQPGDRGWITIRNVKYFIGNAFTMAFNKETGECLVDQEAKIRKIRRDDRNWLFLVGHAIEKNLVSENQDWTGLEAFLEVDHAYRDRVSKAHTGCHLAALALNKVTSSFWKKHAEKLDSLGHPNLDAEAIFSSTITEECSTDRYRCGKSLRKKGFDDLVFFSVFKEVEREINEQLLAWCSAHQGIKIFMTPSSAYLHEKREWHCKLLDGKEAVIPCGGTHISSISHPAKIVITLSQDGDGEFTMITRLLQP